MAFSNYGTIIIKNGKIIEEEDFEIEFYKDSIYYKNEYYNLKKDLDSLNSKLGDYKIIKYKFHNCNITVLREVFIRDLKDNSIIKVLYGYDVDIYFICNYPVAKMCKCFLNRYTNKIYKIKKHLRNSEYRRKYYKVEVRK